MIYCLFVFVLLCNDSQIREPIWLNGEYDIVSVAYYTLTSTDCLNKI